MELAKVRVCLSSQPGLPLHSGEGLPGVGVTRAREQGECVLEWGGWGTEGEVDLDWSNGNK